MAYKHAGEAETWLAIRRRQLVIVAERGDASYLFSGDKGFNYDKNPPHPGKHRWPVSGSYLNIVCEKVP